MHPLLLIPTAFEARLLFDDTTGSLLSAAAGQPRPVEIAGVAIDAALCGFGLAAAGAGAADAVARLAVHGGVSHLLLVGIAGTYHPARAPIGSAIIGTAASCWGIGVGEGAAHRSAASLGWRQAWEGPERLDDGEHLELVQPPACTAIAGRLLSVTAGSASSEDAARRRAAHPAALAEDMESFAVALAARLRRLPLIVVRGISNVAGDRDKASWRAAPALASARDLVIEILSARDATIEP